MTFGVLIMVLLRAQSLICDIMLLNEWFLMYWGTVVPPSSGSGSPRSLLNEILSIVPGTSSVGLGIVVGLLDPKGDSTVILWNFSNHLPNDSSVCKLNLIRCVNNDKKSVSSCTLLRLTVSRMNWWALGVWVILRIDVISFNINCHFACSSDGCLLGVYTV